MTNAPMIFDDPAPPAPSVGSERDLAPEIKVLIVDDEPEIHTVSRLALDGFTFEGRTVRLLHAMSAAEAYVMLCTNLDVAVALVDVVMESDRAGLELVERIREELGNTLVRIILRTGQAGNLPELEVIAKYGINDYREKTGLSASKLRTALHSALTAHRDITSSFAERQDTMFALAKSVDTIEEALTDRKPDPEARFEALLRKLQIDLVRLTG
jgi:CheY-like chemotaxis protein